MAKVTAFHIVSVGPGGDEWHATVASGSDALVFAGHVASRLGPDSIVELRRPNGPPLRMRGKSLDPVRAKRPALPADASQKLVLATIAGAILIYAFFGA